MRLLLTCLLLITSLTFAGKYDRIVENEGLDAVTTLYMTYCEGLLTQFAGQCDSAEIAKISSVIESAFDSTAIKKELKSMVKETLNKEEIRYLKSVYKEDSFVKMQKFVRSSDLGDDGSQDLLQKISLLYLEYRNGGQNQYFEYLNKQKESFTYDYYKPFTDMMAKLLNHLNEKQPAPFQLTEQEMATTISNVSQTIEATAQDILWLTVYVMVDHYDDQLLEQVMELQFRDQTIAIGNKLGYKTVEIMNSKLSQIEQELNL